MTLRHHVFSDRLGRYTGVPMTGKRGRPRKPLGQPPIPRLLERDNALIAYFLEGRTLEETGQKFKITRERARQILVKHGVKARTRGAKIKPPKPPKPTAEQRFWAKVDKAGPLMPNMETQCWNWTASRVATATKKDGARAQGYGHMWFCGKHEYAHHVSWMLANRKLVPRQWILHRCHNSLCVNPNHLYSGTPKDNAQDRERAGRGVRKIPIDKLEAIDHMIYKGRSDKDIAEEFGVAVGTIERHRLRRTHVRYSSFGANFGANKRKLSISDVDEIRKALQTGAKIKNLAAKYNIGRLAIWRIKTGKTYKSEAPHDK